MFLRKYWIPLSVFLVAIAGIGLCLLATQPPKEPIKIYKAVEPEKPTQQPIPQAPVGDTSQGGHVHADGTWHEGPHEQVADAQAPQTETPQPQEALFSKEEDARSTANLLDHLETYLPLAEENRDILKRTYERQLKVLKHFEEMNTKRGNFWDTSGQKERVAEAKANLDAQEQDIANLKKWRDEHANK
ncbi:hypothetical protein F4141_23935 [Candidatus Poribacteria bacterium]|nr:hypothetical protein [Candidatus Poribacteria bacterium]